MLKENTTHSREKSALERRVDMGLDQEEDSIPSPELDVEDLIPDDIDDIDVDKE
jgi:hypothetical protein